MPTSAATRAASSCRWNRLRIRRLFNDLRSLALSFGFSLAALGVLPLLASLGLDLAPSPEELGSLLRAALVLGALLVLLLTRSAAAPWHPGLLAALLASSLPLAPGVTLLAMVALTLLLGQLLLGIKR